MISEDASLVVVCLPEALQALVWDCIPDTQVPLSLAPPTPRTWLGVVSAIEPRS